MTSPIAHHMICRLTDSRVIAPTVEQRRIVARTISEQAAELPLLCFNVPDTHLHFELAAGRTISMDVARRVEIAVVHRLELPVGFVRATAEPIRHQRHLFNAFDYVLKQQPRHGLAWDPHGEASNLQDLLGLRLVAGNTVRTVRELLPRVGRPYLLGLLGVEELRAAEGPIDRVVEAACAAGGLGDLRGRTPWVRAVRRAAVAVLATQLRPGKIAEALGISRQGLLLLRALEPDPHLVHAIRLQLGLRQQIAAHPVGAFVDPADGAPST